MASVTTPQSNSAPACAPAEGPAPPVDAGTTTRTAADPAATTDLVAAADPAECAAAKCTAPPTAPGITLAGYERIVAQWEPTCGICVEDRDEPSSSDYVCRACYKTVCESCCNDMQKYGNHNCSFCRDPSGLVSLGQFAADELAEKMGLAPNQVLDAVTTILGDLGSNPDFDATLEHPVTWYCASQLPLGLKVSDPVAFAAWNMVKGTICTCFNLMQSDITDARTKAAASDEAKKASVLKIAELRKIVAAQKIGLSDAESAEKECAFAKEQCASLTKKLSAAKGQATVNKKSTEKASKEIKNLRGLVERLSGMLPQTTCNFCGHQYPAGTKHSAAKNEGDAMASQCHIPYLVSEIIVDKFKVQAVQAAVAWYTHIVVCLVSNIDGDSGLKPRYKHFLSRAESGVVIDKHDVMGNADRVITEKDLKKPTGISELFKQVFSSEFSGSGSADFEILESIHERFCTKFFEDLGPEPRHKFTDVFSIPNRNMRQFCSWVLPVAFNCWYYTSHLDNWKRFGQDCFSPDELVGWIPRRTIRRFIEGRALNAPAQTFIGTAPFGGHDFLWDVSVEPMHSVPSEVRRLTAVGLLRSAGDTEKGHGDIYARYNKIKHKYYCKFTSDLAAVAAAYAAIRAKHDAYAPGVSVCMRRGCTRLVDTALREVGDTGLPFVRLRDGVCHHECYREHVAQEKPDALELSGDESDDLDMTQELREAFKRCADPDDVSERKRMCGARTPGPFPDADPETLSRIIASNHTNLFGGAEGGRGCDGPSTADVSLDGDRAFGSDTQPYVDVGDAQTHGSIESEQE